MRVIFINTETTGLDPEKDRIISYAIGVWQDGQRSPIQQLHVWPLNPDGTLMSVSEEISKINGYSIEEWQRRGATRGFQWQDAANLNVIQDAIVGGSNPRFDVGFIHAECRRIGMQPVNPSHPMIDMNALLMPLVAAGKIRSASLSVGAKYFGLDTSRAHDSAADVALAIDVWEHVLDRYLAMWGH